MKKAEKVRYIIEYFSKVMPAPETELKFRDNYQLTVSVILSAQCTDVRVNKITPALFNRYPSFKALSTASQQEIYEYIKSCSYPNNKAKSLYNLAITVCNNYGGKIPEDRVELEKLPGIGRKTANVILAVAFNKPYFAVDTHVYRVAIRLGLTKAKTPEKTSEELEKLFPKEVIPKAHHWLLLHGRYCCKARNPICEECSITEICDYIKK